MESLGSSHVSNSTNVHDEHNPPTIRGSKGITSKGRSTVRQAASALELRFGLKNLTFATCTLPPEALSAYTRDSWARLVHMFVRSVKRHLVRHGLPQLIVAVTEIQMQRWEAERGKPPVHLHLLFPGRLPSGQWVFRPSQFQALWQRCVDNEWASHSDFQASTRVEQLRSSSVNYLGKYMSKGCGAIVGKCLGSLPSSWYSVTTELRKICKSMEVRLSGYASHSVYEYFYRSEEYLWARSVMSEFTDQGICYLQAWICQLKGHRAWRELFESLRASEGRLYG